MSRDSHISSHWRWGSGTGIGAADGWGAVHWSRGEGRTAPPPTFLELRWARELQRRLGEGAAERCWDPCRRCTASLADGAAQRGSAAQPWQQPLQKRAQWRRRRRPPPPRPAALSPTRHSRRPCGVRLSSRGARQARYPLSCRRLLPSSSSEASRFHRLMLACSCVVNPRSRSAAEGMARRGDRARGGARWRGAGGALTAERRNGEKTWGRRNLRPTGLPGRGGALRCARPAGGSGGGGKGQMPSQRSLRDDGVGNAQSHGMHARPWGMQCHAGLGHRTGMAAAGSGSGGAARRPRALHGGCQRIAVADSWQEPPELHWVSQSKLQPKRPCIATMGRCLPLVPIATRNVRDGCSAFSCLRRSHYLPQIIRACVQLRCLCAASQRPPQTRGRPAAALPRFATCS